MSQPVSAWAKMMTAELDAWLAEPDPVEQARKKRVWQAKLVASAAPAKRLKDWQREAAGESK